MELKNLESLQETIEMIVKCRNNPYVTDSDMKELLNQLIENVYLRGQTEALREYTKI